MPLEIARPDLDRVAAQVNRGRAVPVPTGVGFCMYMTAAALDAVGELDAEAFGKGYGERERLVPARHQGRLRQPARRGRVRPPCRPDLVRARRGRRVRPGPGERCWPSTPTTRPGSGSSSRPIPARRRAGAARPGAAGPALLGPGTALRDAQLGRGHPAAHRRHGRAGPGRGPERGAAADRPDPQPRGPRRLSRPRVPVPAQPRQPVPAAGRGRASPTSSDSWRRC